MARRIPLYRRLWDAVRGERLLSTLGTPGANNPYPKGTMISLHRPRALLLAICIPILPFYCLSLLRLFTAAQSHDAQEVWAIRLNGDF